jgi:hypothetical protein
MQENKIKECSMKGIALSIILISSSVFAEENDIYSLCSDLSGLSNKIMTARQNGVAMSKLMEAMTNKVPDEQLNNIVRELIISAYETSRYNSEEIKARKISDFENETYLSCIKEFK